MAWDFCLLFYWRYTAENQKSEAPTQRYILIYGNITIKKTLRI